MFKSIINSIKSFIKTENKLEVDLINLELQLERSAKLFLIISNVLMEIRLNPNYDTYSSELKNKIKSVKRILKSTIDYYNYCKGDSACFHLNDSDYLYETLQSKTEKLYSEFKKVQIYRSETQQKELS